MKKMAALEIFYRQLCEIYVYEYGLKFFCGFSMNSKRFFNIFLKKKIDDLSVKSFTGCFSGQISKDKFGILNIKVKKL